MTPAGDRSATRNAVVAAGGLPERWVGGRLKAALSIEALAGLRRSPAVARAELAETSSADTIISQGVALTGADGLQRAGSDGAGVTIVVLDQAFGAATRLGALAGTELPPLERQHRLTFDLTYGLAGRDYNANSSRHGEFVTEIVYDLAPAATYWFLNYHTPDEYSQAVDYIVNVIHPQIVVHSNSFLFGPFDGSGWFAQRVNAAAASGILWVNSAGNYRTRHWEGAWSDADGDGNLDSADGNAFRVELEATSRPACDVSWAGATADQNSYYHLALYQDAALTIPVLDKNTHLPIQSDGLQALPEPHADMPPGAISSPGPYYVAVRRMGTPPTERLTLYCRMDLSPAAQVTGSSSPTPGDAAGAFSVGAFDATTLQPESYSSEGPTDDGRLKPDIAAPTNVLITPGAPESEALTSCGGTSCAAPHVGGAAALLWSQVASDGGAGSVAERVRARLVAQALDVGAPGPDTVFGAGRLRLDLAPPVLGTPSPASNALVRGTVALSLPLLEAGTLGLLQLSVDGKALPATLAPGGVLHAIWPTAGLAPGPHTFDLTASDQSGNSATYHLTLRVDNEAPRVRLRAPQRTHVGTKVHIRASVLDSGSGLAGRPRIAFGDGMGANGFRLAHRYGRPGRYTIAIRATDRAGNSVRVQRTLRVLPARAVVALRRG